MEVRETELRKLGFEEMEDADCYLKDNISIDFWEVRELKDEEWYKLLENVKYVIKQAKIEQERDYKYLLGRNSAEKEIKQQILDLLNKYKSWLQQHTQSKMGRGNPDYKYEVELRAKIDVLIELEKKL